MAFSKIHYEAGLPHGALLRKALVGLETGLDDLLDTVACMAMMIDGDGSDAAHFGEVKSRYAFFDNATAKAAWDELNSLKFKLSTNASVTDVNAALIQAFNKFR